MAVKQGDRVVGEVTSGCLSPTLGYPIAMAYVDVADSLPGSTLQIDLGKAAVEAEVVAMPFYKPKSG
jgi:aminomethyltransferase